MLFLHRNGNDRDGRFYLSDEMTAQAPVSLDNPLIVELWKNFTYGISSLTIQKCATLSFQIGTAKLLSHEGDGYTIRINGDGISVAANDEKNLVRGLLTVFDMMLMDDDGRVYLSYTELREIPRIAMRIVHYCIFPDTELWEIRRFIRLCGVLKYTHIALEFWGMYRFSCLPELSWKHGYTKEQIVPLIAEAHTLGMEVIPMFNHWGHASGSRWMHGKHVTLDQAPALQYLFEDGGWCWNYKSARVRAMMREIRGELMELCGEGTYFLIGCDEAYGFSFEEDEIASVTQYMNEVATELKQKGRRAIMWADMLLMANVEKKYIGGCPNKEKQADMLSRLSRDILLGDWQYDTTHKPVETALSLAEAGFDTILCAWDRSDGNQNACIQTAAEHHLTGIMHTTWHTLSSGMPYVARFALACWVPDHQMPLPTPLLCSIRVADLLRRVAPANGDYEKTGWSKKEIIERT